MTRLRVTVKDIEKVGDEKAWKDNKALGLIVKDKGVQAIYGPKADVLKSDIQDILGIQEIKNEITYFKLSFLARGRTIIQNKILSKNNS